MINQYKLQIKLIYLYNIYLFAQKSHFCTFLLLVSLDKNNCMQVFDAFQWEDNDHQSPFWVHMIAGSCAGLSQHLSMLPLDNLKTHCQAGSNLRLIQIAKNILNAGGVYNFYSGSTILAMGCIPAHAIYFSVFEKTKVLFIKDNKNMSGMYGAVGALSGLFHDIVMTPTEVIKQRMQLMRSQKGNWVRNFELIRSMYRSEGLIAFYRSFGVNYLMNMPFSSILIMVNENMKLSLQIKDNGKNQWKYYLLGSLAGGLASIPTTPFDVIKTKLNTQNCLNNQCDKKVFCQIIKNSQIKQSYNKSTQGKSISNGRRIVKYNNIFDTTKTILHEEGIKGLFVGLKMRIAIQSFSSGIAWGTYHLVKNMIFHTSNQSSC